MATTSQASGWLADALGWLVGFSVGRCAAEWGWTFLIALAACAALYVGGGVGYAVTAQGAEPRLGSHPHISLCGPAASRCPAPVLRRP
jgi:hypothetical protein